MTAALVLSPVPRPSAMPAAMATTFLRAPASSHPTTSVLRYTRNQSDESSSWRSVPTSSSAVASTDAAAWPSRISRARFGPVRAATGWPGATSPITWVIRRPVPGSKPLARLTRGTPGARCGARAETTARMPTVGTATSTTSAGPTTAASSAETTTRRSRTAPGRRGLVRADASSAATPGSRAHNDTSARSASVWAIVVPQLPAPTTAIVRRSPVMPAP